MFVVPATYRISTASGSERGPARDRLWQPRSLPLAVLIR